jgi:putative transposase
MPMGQKVDVEALRERRLAARKLLDEGEAQAEVARRLKVSRQSVGRWAAAPTKQLEAICRLGRKSSIDDLLQGRLRQALLAGAKRQGFSADVWTLPRVRKWRCGDGMNRDALCNVCSPIDLYNRE